MKKYILIAFALLLGLSANAQNDEVEQSDSLQVSGYKIINDCVGYEKIIENTGLSIQQAHDAVVSYFARAFGDSNVTSRVDQPNHIMYKSTFHKIAMPGFGVWWMSSNYIIDVAVRDNRVRVQAYATTGDVYDGHGVHTYSYDIAQTYPVTKNINRNRLYKGMARKVFVNTMLRLGDIVLGVENALKSPSASGDDW